MARVKGRLEYSDELTPGQSKDGGIHHNLYDDKGHLVGHARFFPDDEQGDDSPTPPWTTPPAHSCACEADSPEHEPLDPEELAKAIEALFHFAAWATPHVTRWWADQALPFMRSARSRIVRAFTDDDEEEAPGDSPVLVGTVVSGPPAGAPSELDGPRVTISGEEASARLAAAMLAKAFSEEQLSFLRSARIKEEPALESSPGQAPTVQQVEASIRLILQARPSFLPEESLAELRKALVLLQTHGGARSIESGQWLRSNG